MKRVDGFLVYRLSSGLQKIREIEYFSFSDSETKRGAAAHLYQAASNAITTFLSGNPFGLKMSLQLGHKLAKLLETTIKLCREEEKKEEPITYEIARPVETLLGEFETLLNAELGNINLYLVDQK